MCRSELTQKVPDAGSARQSKDESEQDYSEFSDNDPNQNESLPVLERYRYLNKYTKTKTI
jgi:hypothetical protein